MRSVSGKESGAATDDETLMQQIALRDAKALALLYQRYGSKLYGLAVKMLQNHQESEEVLQDVFVQLWKRAGQYDRAKASPFSWAIIMVRHACIDRLRFRTRKKTLLDRFQLIQPADEVEAGDARALLMASETTRRIAAALEQLPSEQWEPIQMAFYQGLSQWEIAEKTQQPLGTVKSRIRRGMFKLRELLKDIYG